MNCLDMGSKGDRSKVLSMASGRGQQAKKWEENRSRREDRTSQAGEKPGQTSRHILDTQAIISEAEKLRPQAFGRF